MSRRMRLTDSEITKILSEIKEKLENSKSNNSTFTYTFTQTGTPETDPVNITMSDKAYFKMMTYVHNFSSEIAWQGTAEKLGPKDYRIDDVFVYPQMVNSATVNMEDDVIRDWEEKLDVEVYNKRRFHGHSHVNMGVSPSTVDMNMREELIHRLEKDGFYIFMIVNKKEEFSIEVYDKADGKIYDTDDCMLYIEGVEEDMSKVIQDAKNMLYTKKADPVKKTTGGATPYQRTKAENLRMLQADEDDDIFSEDCHGYGYGYYNGYYGSGYYR